MSVIGIDPGLTGGIAMLDSGGDKVMDMPVRSRLNGKGKEVDLWLVTYILDNWLGDDTKVYIEQVGAMPGGGTRTMGATSAFTFGRSVGGIEGVLAALGATPVPVRPQLWKRNAGLAGKPKEVAVTLAQTLWPQLRRELTVQRNVTNKVQALGRADALLIARFGAK